MMCKQDSYLIPLQFLKHFHQMPGIDPLDTNCELIDALFQAWNLREERQVVRFSCRRDQAVTRTLIEWARWIEQPILAITNRDRQMWKHYGVHARLWTSPLIGLRPTFVIIDNPAPHHVVKSVVLKAKFQEWLRRFPFPAFYVNQLQD